jgi:rSAM/selenodomain-associated transferase 1
LVVAKAPVPGRAKTRLGAEVGDDVAAELARASLLDTLESCEAAFDRCFLALEGTADASLECRLGGWTVFPQRGDRLGERLAGAFADVALHTRGPVVQIGMDTPQAGPADLARVATMLADVDAIVGPAQDGGWWALGLRDSRHAQVLREVRMSTPTTYVDTVAALESTGATAGATQVLTDVDTLADADVVAALVPTTRFAVAWSRVPR